MFDPRKAIHRVAAVTAGADDAACRAVLGDIKRLRSFLDRQAAFVTDLAAARVRANGEADTAELIRNATGCTAGEAKRKATTAANLPDMAPTRDALGDGDITGDHADALARLRSEADQRLREALGRDEAELIERAKAETPEQFRRTLNTWRQKNSVDDGIDEQERQRSRTRLTLTKGADGMGLLRGEFDPESFETVSRAINDIADQLFHGADRRPGADQTAAHLGNGRLTAEALVELCRRSQGSTAADGRRARATVIVSTSLDALLGRLDLHGTPTRLADGTTIPAETARRLACDADIIPVVMGGSGQILDVGRSRRLANAAQRAALRLLHPTCAIDWCDKPYDWCDIHHLTPWNQGGRTDLDNLVPLCSKHHHLVHEGGWATERLPNGAHRFRHRHHDPSGSRAAGNRSAGPSAPRSEPPPGRRRRTRPEPSGPRRASHRQPTLIEA
jgi:hypothetical protein